MAFKALKMIKDNDVKFVDLRFTDTRGKEQHVTLPVSQVEEDFFTDGKMFDGSSMPGIFRSITAAWTASLASTSSAWAPSLAVRIW